MKKHCGVFVFVLYWESHSQSGAYQAGTVPLITPRPPSTVLRLNNKDVNYPSTHVQTSHNPYENLSRTFFSFKQNYSKIYMRSPKS